MRLRMRVQISMHACRKNLMNASQKAGKGHPPAPPPQPQTQDRELEGGKEAQRRRGCEIFSGTMRDDAIHDAIWKMRTDARRESISGTRGQLWLKSGRFDSLKKLFKNLMTLPLKYCTFFVPPPPPDLLRFVKLCFIPVNSPDALSPVTSVTVPLLRPPRRA